MRISLVIPAYNEEKYIGRCLESVQKNGVGLFEIIVVNNASTDNTRAIAQSFTRVRVVDEPKKGVNRARQRGLAEARGDIVAFIDADTQMPRQWVARISQLFEKDKKLVCVSGPSIYYDLLRVGKITVWSFWLILAWPTYFITRYMAVAGNFAARKNALKSVNGFNQDIEFYGDDTEIAQRLCRVGKVKFMQRHYMYSSARRLKAEGMAKTAIRYTINFLSVALIKKPLTHKYTDIR